ncbi:Hypothetical protein NocV09_00401050 [Nannochloropsis oceanica]
MHAQRLQSLLGAALIFFNVTEAFVLSRSPLLPSISRSPCSRTGTSTTSKRSVAFQDNQHPRKSQQSHAKDADDILAVLEGKFYQWKHGPVHYVEAGGETAAAEAFPVLLLPGFGVSSSHFERNIGPLSAAGHHVFAIDYLGQGKSWPDKDLKQEDKLVFSIDMWSEQIVSFIQDVIGRPVYISGNSLGGFLATTVAARHPQWVKGVMLLNSTPFWSFAPNRKKLQKWVKEIIIPYDGVLPAPQPLYEIGSRWYNSLRNKNTVKSMLGAVYADDKAWGDRLVEQIMTPTEHKHGQSVFTSILFAPKPEHTFEETLASLQQADIPLLLLYGREDPWIFPSWGQRVKRQVPKATYFELSPAGHCPHHEAPQAVNALMLEWLQEQQEQGGKEGRREQEEDGSQGGSRGGREGRRTFFEPVTGKEISVALLDGQPRDVLEWVLASTFFR